MDDKDTLLRGANSFIGKYTHLSAQDQAVVLSAKTSRDLQRIAGDNADNFFQDLEAYRRLKSEGFSGLDLPQGSSGSSKQDTTGASAGNLIAGTGLATAVAIKEGRENGSLEEFTKRAEKMAEEAGKEWEKEEERLKKNPPKEIDPNRFTSKEEFMDNHKRTSYDYLATSDPKKAKEWAAKNPENLHLSKAVDRNEVWDKKLTFDQFQKARQRYMEKAAIAGASPELVAKLQSKAEAEMNNLLMRANPELAKKWAIQHGDKGLVIAHNADRQRKIEYAKKNQGRLSKLLGRDPAKKFGEEIKLPDENTAPPAVPEMPSATTTAQIATAGAMTSNPNDAVESWEEMEPDIPPPPPPMQTTQAQPMPKMPPQPSDTKPPPPPPSQQRGRQRRGKPGSSALGAVNKAKKVERRIMILTNPAVLAGLIVGAFAILFLFMLAFLYINACQIAGQYPFGQDLLRAFKIVDCQNDNGLYSVPPPPEGFVVIKDAIDDTGNIIKEVENNKPIKYRITVSYTPEKSTFKLAQLKLWDEPIFSYTNLVDVTPPYAKRDDTIEWELSNFFDETANPTQTQEKQFYLTLTPTVQDEIVFNKTSIESPETSSEVMTGADSLPTNNTCRNKYTDSMNKIEKFLTDLKNENPKIAESTKMAGTGYNFGDPVCSFNQARWRQLLHSTEKNQKKWEFWEDIAKCESFPNGMGTQVDPNTGRPTGPFGYLQTNRGYPVIAKESDRDYIPGPEDKPRGDVPWQKQLINAVKKNDYDESVGNNFGFWGVAMCLCNFPYYAKEDAWCGDIKATNQVRNCTDPNNDTYYNKCTSEVAKSKK